MIVHSKGTEIKITDIYQAMEENTIRNDTILDDIISAIVAGRSPLVLTVITCTENVWKDKGMGYAINSK